MNYYEVLGIKQTATLAEIKSAYRRLAMKYHPDRNNGSKQAEEQFKKINEAYACLSDSTKRFSYDSTLRSQQQTNSYSQTNTQYYNPYNYQSAYNQESWKDISRLKHYMSEMLNIYNGIGNSKLRQYIQNLRKGNLATTMPRLHYLTLIFMGYILLSDDKTIPFFTRDISDKNACLNIIKQIIPPSLANNKYLIDSIINILYSKEGITIKTKDMCYTLPEWLAFGKELHGHESDAVWANNFTDSPKSKNSSSTTKTSATNNKNNPSSEQNSNTIVKGEGSFVGFIVMALIFITLIWAYYNF